MGFIFNKEFLKLFLIRGKNQQRKTLRAQTKEAADETFFVQATEHLKLLEAGSSLSVAYGKKQHMTFDAMTNMSKEHSRYVRGHILKLTTLKVAAHATQFMTGQLKMR